jgi:hypothetical protein
VCRSNLASSVYFSSSNFPSPHNSFNDNFQTFQSKEDRHRALSFAEFFDWPYFAKYWAVRNLTCVLLDELEVLKSPILERIQTVDRPWGTRNDQGIKELFQNSGFKLPLEANTTLRFNRFKTVALSNYYQYSRDAESPRIMRLLFQVAESLRPTSSLIRELVTMLQSQMPENYSAIHLRVEGDVAASFEEFTKQADEALTQMKTSQCYLSLYNEEKHIFEKPLFIASGIIFNPEGASESEDEARKREYVLMKLKEIGVSNIFYRSNLISAIPLRDAIGSKLRFLKSFALEQLAWIDFIILRECSCFIPSSGRESSFSYMVQRMKEIGNRQFSTQVKPPLSGWGV